MDPFHGKCHLLNKHVAQDNTPQFQFWKGQFSTVHLLITMENNTEPTFPMYRGKSEIQGLTLKRVGPTFKDRDILYVIHK